MIHAEQLEGNDERMKPILISVHEPLQARTKGRSKGKKIEDNEGVLQASG